MPELIRAHVVPQTLVWARQQAGLDVVEAARRVGITTDRLQAWERGESLPTVRQARLLGKAYHRPAAFFYLAQLPTIPRQLTDFRRLPSGLISTPHSCYTRFVGPAFAARSPKTFC